ncbi:ATP-dependent helicase HrpB [Thalassotalea maritima]|uniref:ATP-dependent helicase HrpB n=1 Tax=Thalassotalea maritima TaxID=3242416 RepID=UPI003528ACC4
MSSPTTTTELPVYAIKSQLEQAIINHSNIILSAPPGAGKSTVLPLWLLASERFAGQKIIMLQPRRLAAKSVALRLASLLSENVGETVGYRMRGESKISTRTRLEVVTEGILTRMILADNELSGVGLIIFDEFHERSLHADLGLALALDIQQGLRDNLSLLIMSATLDNSYLQSTLPDAFQLNSEGRNYPVAIDYQPVIGQHHWLDHLLRVVSEQVQQHNQSILVFLPGSGEIKTVERRLQAMLPSNVTLHGLYGDMDIKRQQQAIRACQPDEQKVVLATNIAETSITIDGITLVIDSGLEKAANYNEQILANQLKLQPISQASAEQRRGRAGRTAPGRCIRLYSQENYQRRPAFSASEIATADLLPLTLDVANWGVASFANLAFIELPNKVTEQHCWYLLQQFSAVDDNHRLTTHGKKITTLACHPRLANMIVMSLTVRTEQLPELLSLACLLAALLEERDIFLRELANQQVSVKQRIYSLLQNSAGSSVNKGLKMRIVDNAKRLFAKALPLLKHNRQDTNNSRAQFCRTLDQLPLHYLGLLLAFAYPERIAQQRQRQGSYLCANGKGAELDYQDPLFTEPYLVIANLRRQDSKLTIALAEAIEETQLLEYFANDIISKEVLIFDQSQGNIRSEKQTVLHHLIINSARIPMQLAADKLANMWCHYVKEKGLSALSLSAKITNLLTRVRWLNQYWPEADFPDVSDNTLLNEIDIWLAPYLINITSISELQALNYWQIFSDYIGYEAMRKLATWAPEHYESPLGRKFSYSYNDQPQPRVALPMQQVYGLTTSPVVANGQTNVVLELLSPAGRPIQITQDLARFWQGSYKQVQKDMKANYPKHYWPDDPANAKPTNKTKKHIVNGET